VSVYSKLHTGCSALLKTKHFNHRPILSVDVTGLCRNHAWPFNDGLSFTLGPFFVRSSPCSLDPVGLNDTISSSRRPGKL
jgi:hypothetical protein